MTITHVPPMASMCHLKSWNILGIACEIMIITHVPPMASPKILEDMLEVFCMFSVFVCMFYVFVGVEKAIKNAS